MNYKRILALALSAVMCFSLVACGNDDENTTDESNITEPTSLTDLSSAPDESDVVVEEDTVEEIIDRISELDSKGIAEYFLESIVSKKPFTAAIITGAAYDEEDYNGQYDFIKDVDIDSYEIISREENEYDGEIWTVKLTVSKSESDRIPVGESEWILNTSGAAISYFTAFTPVSEYEKLHNVFDYNDVDNASSYAYGTLLALFDRIAEGETVSEIFAGELDYAVADAIFNAIPYNSSKLYTQAELEQFAFDLYGIENLSESQIWLERLEQMEAPADYIATRDDADDYAEITEKLYDINTFSGVGIYFPCAYVDRAEENGAVKLSYTIYTDIVGFGIRGYAELFFEENSNSTLRLTDITFSTQK